MGDRCLAPWSDGHSYPAVITSIQVDKAHVTFPDYNEEAVILISLLKRADGPPARAPQWAAGTKCLAAWSDGNYYPAVITSIEGDTAHVNFPEYHESGSSMLSLLKPVKAPPPRKPSVINDSPAIKNTPSRPSTEKGPVLPPKPSATPPDAISKTPNSRLSPTPPGPRPPTLNPRVSLTQQSTSVLKVGDKCSAPWTDGNYYLAVIDSIEGENAQVTFPEYNENAMVALSSIKKLAAAPRPPEKKGSGPEGASLKVGDVCSAPWSDGNHYNAKIMSLNPPSAEINFVEYNETATVQIAALKIMQSPDHSRNTSMSVAPTTELLASGELCGECKQPVAPPYLKYKGQAFHKDCIETQLPKCKRCNLPATGKLRKQEGQRYHVACYTCFTCHAPKERLVSVGPEVYCEPCSVVPKKQSIWQDMGVTPLAHSADSTRKVGSPPGETRGLKSLTMTLKSSLHLTRHSEVAEPAPMLSDAEIIAQMKLAAGPILEAQLKRALEEGAEQEEIDRLKEQLAAMTDG